MNGVNVYLKQGFARTRGRDLFHITEGHKISFEANKFQNNKSVGVFNGQEFINHPPLVYG